MYGRQRGYIAAGMVSLLRAFVIGVGFFVAGNVVVAAPVEVTVYSARNYKYAGKITLRDPFTDVLLGSYEFVSGGYGRGSTPFGTYIIGEFIDDGRPRWNVHAPGADDGEVWDDRVHDIRTEIQLHRIRTDAGTLGCLGVVADVDLWAKFVKQLRYIQAGSGPISFQVGTPTFRLAAVGVLI